MKTIRLLVLVAAAIPAIAKADASLLSTQQVSKIAGAMFQAYNEGNVGLMYAVEMKCWDGASKTERADKKRVAECAVAGMAGAFIDATYARKQRRGSHPQYTGEAVRERVMELSGLSTADAQSVLESTIEPNVPTILTGLMNAGMR